MVETSRTSVRIFDKHHKLLNIEYEVRTMLFDRVANNEQVKMLEYWEEFVLILGKVLEL